MKNHKKNVIWNTIGATASSFISLFLLIIVTRINGLEEAGIFTYSFAFACILYCIGVYFTRTYQVTETNEKFTDGDFIYNRITTCLMMLIAGFLFLLIKDYSFHKNIIFILLVVFKCIEAFGESLYAIIQRKNNIHKVGKSMFLKSFIGTIVFLAIDIITKNVVTSILFLIIVNILIIIIYDFKNIGLIEKTKFSFEKNKLLLKAGFYTFAFSIMSIYVINASRYAIDGVLNEEIQAIYGIIIMPATIMSLFSQFIIQPYLVKIKDKLKREEHDEFIKIIKKILLAMLIIGLPSITVAYYVGVPVLEIVYGVSLKPYLMEFLILMIGALFYGYIVLISTILIAMRKTFEQFIILLITVIIAYILAKYLVNNYDILGACIAYFITMFIEFVMYTYILIKQLVKIKEAK